MIYDLDNVVISQRIFDSWMAYLPIAVEDLQEKFKDIRPDEIPDEQFRLLEDGRGQIFINIRNTEIKMNLQPDEFKIIIK